MLQNIHATTLFRLIVKHGQPQELLICWNVHQTPTTDISRGTFFFKGGFGKVDGNHRLKMKTNFCDLDAMIDDTSHIVNSGLVEFEGWSHEILKDRINGVSG